jgi:hypothetical protein
MAESKTKTNENVYVKIGSRGQYLERTAGSREIDRVNLIALGFVPKGSKGAPKPSDATYKPEPVDPLEVPTSVRAAAEHAEKDSGTPKS